MKQFSRKNTLVLGASLKPERYSHKAILMLEEAGHPVHALGLRQGMVGNTPINTDPATIDSAAIHTVALYLNPKRQEAQIDFILSLKPERVIFNPGTENAEFQELLRRNGAIPVEACTLVLLSIGQY